ncbi:hypothetical protein Q2E61_09205 [Microbulbifer thermotolerans]|uniref:hypothetical protein n=1 Tax=Microbulbifer thermotolerans TaxID=252514 RepID=UPI00267417EA|nr:hypothetical protein [Microbulbifer thermotolerans]WKT59104.1 hypothetical protein Q2E61_09205 [Microbulbifer thermotolerans]
MLNGIGGNTIEEAQQRLSLVEVQRWAAYRRKRGSLHWGMRIERSIALLAKIYVDAHRRKGAPPVSLYEFTPHDDEPELTFEQAAKLFG